MLKVLLTCEHGGNTVPAAYAPLFADQQELLHSHRGYDIGAKDLYEELKTLANASFFADTTRLLVELNRSLHNRSLFSTITGTLPEPEKARILERYYFPYRQAVERALKEYLGAGQQVLHVSVHSFTPVLQGIERQADVGLLYDPKRSTEKNFCQNWKKLLLELNPDLQVRFNYPYAGVADGFPTFLRRTYSEKQYMGIELEINQKFPQGNQLQWQQMQNEIKVSLEQLLKLYLPTSL